MGHGGEAEATGWGSSHCMLEKEKHQGRIRLGLERLGENMVLPFTEMENEG